MTSAGFVFDNLLWQEKLAAAERERDWAITALRPKAIEQVHLTDVYFFPVLTCQSKVVTPKVL